MWGIFTVFVQVYDWKHGAGYILRQGRSIKIEPSVLRKAHHRAIESQKTVGKWVGEAIEEKVAREQRTLSRKYLGQSVFLEDKTRSDIV